MRPFLTALSFMTAIVLSARAEESAQLPSQVKPTYVMCKNKDVVRTIRIVKTGTSCKVVYTKDGVDSIVGKSSTEDVCREVFDKIKINLEKADWKCKDITQARVSSVKS